MGADSWNSSQHRATFNDVTNYNQRVATTSAVSLTPLVCLEGVYVYYTVGPLYNGHLWGTKFWPLYRGGLC